MKILNVKPVRGRDLYGDLVCEHCGAQGKLSGGYDDCHWHSKVLPAFHCEACGLNRAGEPRSISVQLRNEANGVNGIGGPLGGPRLTVELDGSSDPLVSWREEQALGTHDFYHREDYDALRQEAVRAHRELIELKRTLAQVKEQAENFRSIRKLMGYVQNGTETTVALFQDDATRGFFVKIGNASEAKGATSYHGETLEQAIAEALADNPEAV